MSDDVERSIQRTKRYWYEDGLVELAAGLVFTSSDCSFTPRLPRAGALEQPLGHRAAGRPDRRR